MADLYQFLCVHHPATLAFGTPIAEARKRTADLSAMLAASGMLETDIRKDTEESLRVNIERGFHNSPRHQVELATYVMWLTMTSEAAGAAPDAKGFIIEFSSSPINFRNPMNTTVYVTGSAAPGAAGTSKPTKFHRSGVPDLAEVNAASRLAARYVHYWTEPDGDAVLRLAERVRKEVAEAWARLEV